MFSHSIRHGVRAHGIVPCIVVLFAGEDDKSFLEGCQLGSIHTLQIFGATPPKKKVNDGTSVGFLAQAENYVEFFLPLSGFNIGITLSF